MGVSKAIAARAVNFKEMIPYKIYKNINCFDDQMYMKKEDQLLTFSKMSKGVASYSSASRTSRVFVNINVKLTKRF